MMFGRNKKGKRGDHQTGLDVKARSKSVRALRLRLATGALAFSAGAVLFLFVVWKGGEWLLNRYVYTNPGLAITELEITTDGIIPLEQIRAWADVRKGDNLLALDLLRVKRNLELVPLVESASVERYLPHRLVVRVSEREPIARILLFQPQRADGLIGQSVIYLDDQGMVIPHYARSLNARAFDAATQSLPLLTGISPEDLRSGHKVERRSVLAALKWLREFDRSEMAGRADVKSIDISANDTLVVTTGQGNEVTFSLRDFPGQLARWRRVHDYAWRSSRLIASLDLAVTNYVPASWIELTNSPPPVINPPRQSPYKKRHV